MNKLDPLSDKAQQAAHMGRLANPANGRENTIEWLESLGSKFVNVWLYLPARATGGWFWSDERHIDDPETLDTTVSMSLERLGGKYAIWRAGQQWVLLRRWNHETSTLRHYPNREAAEMVAIHGG